MAVIWGLDLKEIQWSKFKNSNMWNNEYHRRRTKFIVYQLAMIFMVVSESLGTAALSDYNKTRSSMAKQYGVHVHTRDFVGVAAYNIFVGVYVATIFGSAFFFDLFWPERKESRAVKLAWKICSLLACIFTLASAIAFTIILATRRAFANRADDARSRLALSAMGGNSPLRYKDNARGIASIVFLWLGVPSVIASTFLLWHSLDHIDRHGPKSTHARVRDELKGDGTPDGTPDEARATESTENPAKNVESASTSTATATIPTGAEEPRLGSQADGTESPTIGHGEKHPTVGQVSEPQRTATPVAFGIDRMDTPASGIERSDTPGFTIPKKGEELQRAAEAATRVYSSSRNSRGR